MSSLSIPHLYVTGTNYEIGFKTVNVKEISNTVQIIGLFFNKGSRIQKSN